MHSQVSDSELQCCGGTKPPGDGGGLIRLTHCTHTHTHSAIQKEDSTVEGCAISDVAGTGTINAR
eukprot:6484828-Amphidinium_carterae.1